MTIAVEWQEHETEYLKKYHATKSYDAIRVGLFNLNNKHDFYPGRTIYLVKNKIKEMGLINKWTREQSGCTY
jgi:hypothetical protein